MDLNIMGTVFVLIFALKKSGSTNSEIHVASQLSNTYIP